jgi:hypothetical protein
MLQSIFNQVKLNVKGLAIYFGMTFILCFICCADSWDEYLLEILEFSFKMGIIFAGAHIAYTFLMLLSAFVYPKISPKMYKFYKRNLIFTEMDEEIEHEF